MVFKVSIRYLVFSEMEY